MLLLDNVDVLVGDALLSVLLQLRTGHVERPTGFPQSVVLCGVNDVRHHRFCFGESTAIPASTFSMMAEWLRLGDFTEAETYALMEQHTAETKQPFEDVGFSTDAESEIVFQIRRRKGPIGHQKSGFSHCCAQVGTLQ